MIRILQGDVRDKLAELPANSVDCVVTSPPYWGLRDYGVSGQIGLEPTVGDHIRALLVVFRDVKRVLRKDGTLWLNYGDAYCSVGHKKSSSGNGTTGLSGGKAQENHPLRRENDASDIGLKHKDLMGLPWRLAFALQDDGWWLRSDIIWSKPNPMPESVTDRPTRSHEYIFLLTKSAKYFYDAAAIRTEQKEVSVARMDRGNGGYAPPGQSQHSGVVGPREHKDKQRGHGRRHAGFNERWDQMPKAEQVALGANARTVWEIATQPFSEAHFATFPPELAERCIKAGCPAGGTVLDPFGGAGTTGLVADRLQRSAILIELNPEYAAMARRRIEGDAGMFSSVA